MVGATLRRRGIRVAGVKPLRPLSHWNQRIAAQEMTVLTRQLATMLNAGVPLLQTLGILAESHANPALVRLLHAIGSDIETGSSFSEALAKYPRHFDTLFCNLAAAGEQAGMLDQLLTRLADTRERNGALRNRLRAALIYPIAIIAVALLATAVIMVWVVPAFRDVFAGFGAELPLATRMVIGLSDWFVRYWAAALAGGAMALTLCFHYWKRSITIQRMVDRLLLKLPVFGPLAAHACIARWLRTLATMFAAGVPLLSSMEIVGKASGNSLYLTASRQIQRDLNDGRGLAEAIGNTRQFPNLVAQMAAIGEESGTLDRMLAKAADFYEAEFSQAVGILSSVIEPVIMVVLGGLVGALVIAMYLPIFQLGAIV
ncbi:type II secretion system F family protein [Oxalobacteraceae bacterium CAVE-383]|nr:type II secretion system F family protein [Oxalobacteraceae bacterium CAVE-383]